MNQVLYIEPRTCQGFYCEYEEYRLDCIQSDSTQVTNLDLLKLYESKKNIQCIYDFKKYAGVKLKLQVRVKSFCVDTIGFTTFTLEGRLEEILEADGTKEV
jgi:hypothetical protein